MWQALAQLVPPGMSRQQVQIVLPPFPGSDGDEIWNGDGVIFPYGLDADWGAQGMGFGKKINGTVQPVLTGAPRMVPISSMPHIGLAPVPIN